MVEILVWGDITKEFARLGITGLKTYQSAGHRDDISVWELTDAEFKALDGDPASPLRWAEAGCAWRHSEGSVLGPPDYSPIVNHHRLKAWYGFDRGKRYGVSGPYGGLLTYCEYALGLTTNDNVTAVTVDLAKHNNLLLSELWKKYQG